MSNSINNIYACEINWDFTQRQADAATKLNVETHGWDPSAHPIWAVEKGQLGWVRDQAHDKHKFANIQILGRKGNGWIPRNWLTQGVVQTEKRGVSLTFTTPYFTSNQSLDDSITNTRLSRTIWELCQAMKPNKDVLVESGAIAGDIALFGDSSEFMKLMLRGMETVGSRVLFDNQQPSWEDLFRYSERDSVRDLSSDTSTCVYVILYREILPGGKEILSWYVGQTVNFSSRRSAHMKMITRPEPPEYSVAHYRIARATHQSGGDFWMFKLVDYSAIVVPPSIKMTKVLLFAEQIMQILLKCWHPTLLNGLHTINDIGAVGDYFVAATTMEALITKVFTKTGWKPGNVRGTNWATPMMECRKLQYSERVLRVSNNIPFSKDVTEHTIMKQFRRPPRKLHASGDAALYIELQAWSTRYRRLQFVIDAKVAKEQGLRNGTLVYPRVEITMNNRDHPIPYARMPRHGPWSDWSVLNRVGIIIEWESDKGWKSFALQAQQFFEVPGRNDFGFGDPNAQFISRTYVRTMDLARGLMQMRFATPPAPWVPEIIPFRVLHCYFNHLVQRLEMIPLTKGAVPPPTLVSRNTIEQQLDQHYRFTEADGTVRRLAMGRIPNNVFLRSVPLGAVGGPKVGPETKRKMCDLCYIHMRPNQDLKDESTKLNSTPPKCTSVADGTDQCTRCLRLNRPCTWTPRFDLIKRGWGDLGVSRYINVVHDIDPPEFRGELLENFSNEESEESEEDLA